jgi:hypothetical protein
MKYAYIISNGRYMQEFTLNDSDDVPKDAYVSPDKIDCTKYQPDVNGNPQLIPVIPPPNIPQPTKLELTNRALDVVNAEYSALLSKLAYIYIKPELAITNSPTEVAANKAAIATEFRTAQAELLTKQGVILNG